MTLKESKEYTKWLLVHFGVTLLMLLALSYFPIGRDDTDPGQYGKRSGMKPIVDNLTGCQYLAIPSGGITPRLDPSGLHICGT